MKKILLFVTLLTSIFAINIKTNAADIHINENICEYTGVAHKGALVFDQATPKVTISSIGSSFVLNVYFKDGNDYYVQTQLIDKMLKFYRSEETYAVHNGKVDYENDKVRTAFLTKGTCPPHVVVGLKSTGSNKELVISSVSFKINAPSDCSSIASAYNFNYTVCSVENVTTKANLLQTDFASSYKFNAKTCPSSVSDQQYIEFLHDTFRYILERNDNTELLNIAHNKYLGDIAEDLRMSLQSGACAKVYKEATGTMKEYYDWFLKYNSSVYNKVGKHDEKDDENKYANKCQYILGDPSKEGYFAYYLDMTFRFIKFAAPVILIVMSVIDYIKVVASSDADELKKVNKKTVTRIIFTLLIFLLPILISVLLRLLGLQGSCDFPNINGL